MNRKEVVKDIKIFFVAFACCIPLFVVIGIFLTPLIGDVWTVVIYVLIGAVAYVLALIISKKRQEKLELKREKSKMTQKYKQIVETDDKSKK